MADMVADILCGDHTGIVGLDHSCTFKAVKFILFGHVEFFAEVEEMPGEFVF